MRKWLSSTVIFMVAFAPLAYADSNIDSDGDGLSDFQETHKYFTNPKAKDSDGDGTPDGDWDERREYAYTIRTITRVMLPVSRNLNDDYQDARELERTDTWVKLEVVHYPLNTVAKAIKGDAQWRETSKRFKEETSSTLTSNFDETLSKKLVDLLAEDGIDVAALDDKTLVEKATPWLLKRVDTRSEAFTGYFTHFADGKPAICPGCMSGMQGYNRGKRSPEEQWARDLFAQSMFENGTSGSCTSTAIYLTGMLRAIGIPTRIVYCIPVIDASDKDELAMLGGLRHERVRETLGKALGALGSTWAGHTFNEVFVGGRWRRLNYSTLGQNTYGPRIFGLVTHVLTVNDWSEADAARTIGVRQCGSRGKRDIFGHRNPYSTVELSDRFGAHMKREPSAPTMKHGAVTLVDFTWSDSTVGKQLLGSFKLPAGRLLARVRDYDGNFAALKAHQQGGDRSIWLEPKQGERVSFRMGTGGITRDGQAWVIYHATDGQNIARDTSYDVRAGDAARWRIDGEPLIVRK